MGDGYEALMKSQRGISPKLNRSKSLNIHAVSRFFICIASLGYTAPLSHSAGFFLNVLARLKVRQAVLQVPQPIHLAVSTYIDPACGEIARRAQTCWAKHEAQLVTQIKFNMSSYPLS
jgi:hypothetical protein